MRRTLPSSSRASVVVLQHDVERLIPRHIIEHDGQVYRHLGIEHDVEAADFVNEAEEVFQVNILQVDRDRLSRVLRPATRSAVRLAPSVPLPDSPPA